MVTGCDSTDICACCHSTAELLTTMLPLHLHPVQVWYPTTVATLRCAVVLQWSCWVHTMVAD